MKHVNFTYGGKLYIQIDREAMGAPLNSLLVDIFMMSLEKAILTTIKNHVVHWSRYVDDTHAYINPSKFEFVLEKLNSHHPNIHFIHKIEKNATENHVSPCTSHTYRE